MAGGIRRPRIPVINKNDAVPHKNFRFDGHAFADKGVARYLAALANLRALLHFNEWTDLIDAIRNDKPYNEVKRGVEASVVSNMGRFAAEQMIATLDGKPVERVLNPEVWPRYAARFKETFDRVVSDELQDMVDTNFKFYKRVTDDPAFGKYFLDWLFDRFRRATQRAAS